LLKFVVITVYRDGSGGQLSALELISSGLFNASTGELTEPQTGRALSLEQALSLNLIDTSDARLLLKTTSPVIATTIITSQIQYAYSLYSFLFTAKIGNKLNQKKKKSNEALTSDHASNCSNRL